MTNWLTPVPSVQKTQTANGDKAYTSTGTYLLDFFSAIGAHRDSSKFVSAFNNARLEDEVLAIRALFYARDIREGQGEREMFRAAFKQLPSNLRDKYVAFIPEFGRWDDVLASNKVKDVVELIREQLQDDWDSLQQNKSVSLLAKWLPSENASSKTTKANARTLAVALGLDMKQYRLVLSTLRRYLNLVESNLSQKEYDKINIQLLPSRAVGKYKAALQKYIPEQFAEVMKAVTEELPKGVVRSVKLNTKTLYPHEVLLESNHALRDAQWAQTIRDGVYATEDTLVVCDTSGSMGYIGSTVVQPIHVALANTLYFAETNSPGWRGSFITFSDTPRIQKLVQGTLTQKALALSKADWAMSTDLNAVFSLIFHKAKNERLAAPKNIVIISDMQFNRCVAGGSRTTFEKWKTAFAKEGLTLPTVVFWNVKDSGSKPVTADTSGAILVSGASPAASLAFKHAMAGVTPYKAMVQLLTSERYSSIV